MASTVDEIGENRSRLLGRVLKSDKIEAARVTKKMVTVWQRKDEKKWRCDVIGYMRVVGVLEE